MTEEEQEGERKMAKDRNGGGIKKERTESELQTDTQYLRTENGEKRNTTESERAGEILTRQKLEEEWNKRFIVRHSSRN